MLKSRTKRLAFERLEKRCVFSAAAVAALPAPMAQWEAAAPTAAPQVAPAASPIGTFDGRVTINYIGGSLGTAEVESLSTLYVARDQEFHFVLTSALWGVPSASNVQMVIRDATGNSVFAMNAAAGDTQAAAAYLEAGTYTASFTRDPAGPAGGLRFELGGVTLPLADTTQDPAESSAAATLAELSFYWQPTHAVSASLVPQSSSALAAASPSPDAASAAAHLDSLAIVYAQPAAPFVAGFHPAAAAVADTTNTGKYASTSFPLAATEAGSKSPALVLASTSAGLAEHDEQTAADPAASAQNQAAAPLLQRHARAARVRAAAIAEVFIGRESAVELADAAITALTAKDAQHAPTTVAILGWFELARENAAWAFAPTGVALGWYAVQSRRRAPRVVRLLIGT